MTDRSAAHAELEVLCAAHGSIGIAISRGTLVTSVNSSWSAENASLNSASSTPTCPRPSN